MFRSSTEKPTLRRAPVDYFPNTPIDSDVESSLDFKVEEKSSSITLSAVLSSSSAVSEIYVDDYEACSPHNWPPAKKLWTTFLICIYTFSIYICASMCLASVPTLMATYKITQLTASMSMSLFVLGYGVGAMLFCPLSEIVSVGRNPPYIISLGLFVVCSVIVAASKSWPLFVAARFFQGFMGSPALATGGASLQDMYDMKNLPVAFTAWVAAATCGPALGPAISIYSTKLHSWRWPLWEMVGLSALTFALMLFLLPETYHPTIARRKGLSTPTLSERSQTVTERLIFTIKDTVFKPVQIMNTNPIVFFANFYTCLISAIFYSFFESFPLVYIKMHGFTYEQFGLSFMAVSIGTAIGVCVYCIAIHFFRRHFERNILEDKLERCLNPACLGAFLISGGIFMFAFTARMSVHWVASLAGVVITSAGVFIILQCLAYYLLLAYPRDAASLLAGNDMMRASVSACAISWSFPLYEHLGVEKGVLVLASVTILCVAGIFAMRLFGHKLRESRS